MFRKWFEEQTLLRCFVTFALFEVTLEGRIFGLDDSMARIISDNKLSELGLRLSPTLQFGYGEPPHSHEDAILYQSFLAVYFGPVPHIGEPEMISFAERK
jgi:hypothetical protein